MWFVSVNVCLCIYVYVLSVYCMLEPSGAVYSSSVLDHGRHIRGYSLPSMEARGRCG